MSDRESNEFSGKVAIITGGASGMGLATVHRFLAAGACVVVADLNEAAAEKAFATLAQPERLRFVRTDVSNEEQIERMVAVAVEEFGRLDILFNNAGLGGAVGPITEVDYSAWQRTFNILTGGVFLGTKHGARRMIAQGEGGVILNTSSIASFGAGAGPAAYSAAKAAVNNFTEVAAVEFARHRIRVNTICPGAIYTPLLHGGDPREIEDADRVIREIQPWPERGQPEHIADVAYFLCSRASEFITGQMITVDGGVMACGPRFFGAQRRTQILSHMAGFTAGNTGEAHSVRRLDAAPKE
jgi:NAD(P)-dependent dehydrogenase (short-subunit alcohol dehydrogenase family)